MLSKWLSLAFLLSAGCLIGDLPGDGVIASDSRTLLQAASEPKAGVAPVYPPPISNGNSVGDDDNDTLGEVVEDLNAKLAEISEPSRQSERQYVAAVRGWLDTLDPPKREIARKIMREAHPGLKALREAIRNKKTQLASISFDKGMPPEALPRLGMELQQLRASLNAELDRLSNRLKREANVEVVSPGDSYWLSPPSHPLN